jgi:hypothetical protein
MDGLAGGYASSSSSSGSSRGDSGTGAGRPTGGDEGDDDIQIVSITPAPESAPFPGPATCAAAVGPSRPPVGDSALSVLAEEPASPTPSPSPALAQWVANALERREAHGLHFEDKLRGNAKFQNPAICAKMIAFCGLDERGTYVEGRGDHYGEDGGFYDVLAERQRKIAEDAAARGQTSKLMQQQQQQQEQQQQQAAAKPK